MAVCCLGTLMYIHIFRRRKIHIYRYIHIWREGLSNSNEAACQTVDLAQGSKLRCRCENARMFSALFIYINIFQ